MSEWITDFKNNPPPNGLIVECLGNWAGGDYVFNAKRKDYKQGAPKHLLKRGWRWVGVDNLPLTRKDSPSAWRYKAP